jgi:hypothetical protein
MNDARTAETGLVMGEKARAAAERLGTEQRSALEKLLGGKSVAESAELAGVSRATVYRWLKSDFQFRAAYNQWHDEMEESARSKLLMMSDLAAGAVRTALEKGDARTAMQLLKELGLMKPGGERLLDAGELKQRAELDEKRRRIGLKEEARKIESEAKQSRGFDRTIEEMFEKRK